MLAERTARSGRASRARIMMRIATVSTALGIAVMIVTLAVVSGFRHRIYGDLRGFGSDVRVCDVRVLRSGAGEPMPRSDSFLEQLRRCEGVAAAWPYAEAAGMAKNGEQVAGLGIKGVDGECDLEWWRSRLVAGEMPSIGGEERTKDLLISRATASALRLGVGDKVEMLFMDGEGRPRRDRFVVSGLYDTGFEELDRTTALTDLRNVQRLSGWSSGEVSGYDLFLGDVRQADRLAEAVNDALLRSDLPETDGVVAVSVGERYPAVFDWLKAHDVNAAVVIAVMVAVAFFNMASALLILVLERTRMIGLLKAMGMENRRIRRIFLYRAAFIVGRGLLWGNLAAGLLCWFQARFHLLRLDPAGYMLSEVPVAVSAGWWLAVDVAAAGAILALLLVPAAFVARIRPDEAIKTD